MNCLMEAKALSAILAIEKTTVIKVCGMSMQPTLKDGDVITIQKDSHYLPGDIIVFVYKQGELLVHRVLKKESRLFCKGDNSFRLEDVETDAVIGRVILSNGRPIDKWEAWKIDLSYAVNREFIKSRYCISKTINSNTYKMYEDLVLEHRKDTLYRLASVDAQSSHGEDGYFIRVNMPIKSNFRNFKEQDIMLLSLLSKPCNSQTLTEYLCLKTLVSEQKARSEVGEFLFNAACAGVVELR